MSKRDWSWVYMHDRYTIESMDESICHVSDKETADLIAAAPELLYTLKALVQKTESRDNPIDEGVSSTDAVMDAAREAIAKAEGKAE